MLSRSGRVRLASLVLLMLVTLLGAPGAGAALEATPRAEATPGTEAVPPVAAGPCDQSEPEPIDGVFVEDRLTSTVIAGSGSPQRTADATIICIETAVEAFPISQERFATTIIVLSGDVTVNVDGAAPAEALAVYYRAATPDVPENLAATPVTLTAGDMLVVGNVEIMVTPATSGPARLWIAGIPHLIGGACPGGCYKVPPR